MATDIKREVIYLKISMIGRFQILEKRTRKFVPLQSDNVQNLSIGGYSFEIEDDLIPFDWDAFSVSEENGIFSFETGRGPFFNDYEIPDYWDEEYKEIGITREEITAEFLASAHCIEDFFVNFDDRNGKEHGVGWCADNVNNSQYKINIIELSFVDVETSNDYPVSMETINNYNHGVIL